MPAPPKPKKTAKAAKPPRKQSPATQGPPAPKNAAPQPAAETPKTAALKKAGAPAAPSPASPCQDRHCVRHKHLSARGRTFVGTVVSDRRSRTVTVQWERRHLVRKYERYERRRTRIHAHNPDCIAAKAGQQVRLAETRPISKTKHFVVVEILGQEDA